MDTSSKQPRAVIPSQTLFRGLDILEVVAEGIVTVAAISARTGLSLSTTHRLASALVQLRYLKFEARKGYSLGSKLIELGFLAYKQSDLPSLARPILTELSMETNDTIHLAALDGYHVVYLDKLPGKRSVEVSSRIGGRKPVCTTGVGKALLIDKDEAQWVDQFDHGLQAKDNHNKAQWIKMMKNCVEQGYAFDLGEDDPAVRCVAAPIRDARGNIIAAVSVSSAMEYMDDQRMDTLIPRVLLAADAISEQMGGSRTTVHPASLKK